MRFSKSVRWALVSLLAIGCVPSGSSDGGGNGGNGGNGGDADGGLDGGPVDESICRQGPPALDLLLVVDNSGSMCAEQEAFAAAFGELDARLTALGVDWRAAVVSTDMNPGTGDRGRFLARPAPPVPALNCIDQNGNPGVPDTEDCQALVESGELSAILQADQYDDPEDRARHYRCLTTLGTQGDGFEKGLEAMRLGLSCDGPNAERFGDCCVDGRYDRACAGAPDFLRPEAVLAVVVISDENDCSDPASNPARSRRAICRFSPTDSDGDGIPDGFGDPTLCGDAAPEECYRAECGMLTPEACREQRCESPRTDNNACEWLRDDLTPVGDYADFLLSRKRARSQVVFASLAAPQLYTPGGFPVTFNPGQTAPECMSEDGRMARLDDECCPEGRCVGPIQPICDTAQGARFAGHRYHDLAISLGGVGCEALGEGCASLCAEEPMLPFYGALADRIAAAIPPPCAEGEAQ